METEICIQNVVGWWNSN